MDSVTWGVDSTHTDEVLKRSVDSRNMLLFYCWLGTESFAISPLYFFVVCSLMSC